MSGDASAGAIHIFYGSSLGGLTGNDDQVWDQETGSIQSIAEPDDFFGFSLVARNYDGDRFCDLAVGVPYEDWNLDGAGIVQIRY
jgi:hypothetical protein